MAARTVLGAVLACAAYVLAGSWLYYMAPPRFPRHRLESLLIVLGVLAAIAFALLEPLKPSGGAQSFDAPTPTRSRQWILRLGVALGGSLLLYWPALSIGWLSDDFIMRNWAASHEWTTDKFEYFRPLPLIAWNVLLPLGGAPVVHLALVLLHGVNAFLVSELAVSWKLGEAGAWIATGLFLVWPTHVEPVVWASGIFDVTATSLTLGVLGLLARSSPAWTLLAAGLPLCAAALLSKESALALPLLAVVAIVPAGSVRAGAGPSSPRSRR